ncbi:unnamed protein product (mitochondrion) [Plasmodiophora brassicae]|uniref:RNA helicase n=1 Tax=Plasmodiophora brassicae TaxID=37360 RepID=A0A3P3YHD7_PLABS|nr:unnamed protein product [Plasmodiophora brassicae]
MMRHLDCAVIACGTAGRIVMADDDDAIAKARASLPVFAERELIVESIRASQFVVLTGATGSGKSTQIAQYVWESVVDQTGDRMIAVSQPRRVGAIALARRVAHESNTGTVGDFIGYTIRFEDCTSPETRIRFITDGCLLREATNDRLLSRYATIILDEAHERSLQTDILLGLMREIAHRRPDLRVVITSATLDTAKFSSFFNGCPTISIPGRCYPVEIVHLESMEQCKHYVDAAVDLVCTIHCEKPPGHVLVFLTGQDEIERACTLLGKKLDSLIEDGVEMDDVPAPPGCRKILFSTNIGETSLTVDGVVYVVDIGLAKQKTFDPVTGIDSLDIVKISRVSATQRAGRAGRTQPGICYRLYSQEDLASFPTETLPEIQRCNLSHAVLLLKQIGVSDPTTFRFIDQPPREAIEAALVRLFLLGGLDADGRLTDLGNDLARLPLEPSLALLLIKSIELDCFPEMLTIAAMMSVENLWVIPRQKVEDAQTKHMAFKSKHGDLLTTLVVFNEWVQNRKSQEWCQKNFLNFRALHTADMIRRQLKDSFKSLASSRNQVHNATSRPVTKAAITGCRRAIAYVYFDQCAHRVGDYNYRLNRDVATHHREPLAAIHPQSALKSVLPKWVVYRELVNGNRPLLRNVTAIEFDFIADRLPRLREANIGRLTGHRQRDERDTPAGEPPSKPCAHEIDGKETDAGAVKRDRDLERIDEARRRFVERKKQRTTKR